MGYIVYKCRRCGENGRSGVESDEERAEAILMHHSFVGAIHNDEDAFGKTGVYPRSTHRCRDGGIGISDFAGWDKD